MYAYKCEILGKLDCIILLHHDVISMTLPGRHHEKM